MTVALGLSMVSERLHEPPLPPGHRRASAASSSAMSTCAAALKHELLSDRAASRHHALYDAGKLVFEQPLTAP